MLHVFAIVLGSLAFLLGFMLVFCFKQFQELSSAVNRVLFDENQVARYRISIGLILLGSSILVLVGSHYLKMAGH